MIFLRPLAISLTLLVSSAMCVGQEKETSPRPVDNDIPSAFTAPKTTPFEAPKAEFDYV